MECRFYEIDLPSKVKLAGWILVKKSFEILKVKFFQLFIPTAKLWGILAHFYKEYIILTPRLPPKLNSIIT
jgi:hypothetical protein